MYKSHYNTEMQCLVFAAEDAPVPPFNAGTNIFVCGALQNPEKMNALIRRNAPFICAAVQGFKRDIIDMDGRPVPFMLEDELNPQAVLTGVVWLGLSDAEVKAVEGLELDGGYRKPHDVYARAGEIDILALTYIKS